MAKRNVLKKMKSRRRNTTKKINKRKVRKSRKSRKSRKTMKGGATPFSEIGNIFSQGMYHAQTFISPLTNRLVDDTIINPNPAVQFPQKNEMIQVSGPELKI